MFYFRSKGSFKITVTETTLSNDVWRGKFNLKSYSDEDDTYTSSPVSIGINENYEEYVRQRIEKILNKSDDNYYDIVGLFKQDLTVFKSELKKYCLDSLNTFQKCCQSCIDIMVQQGVASDSSTATTSNAINAKAIYDSLYVPYYNKLNAIQDEILVREDEVYTVEGKYNNQNELIQDGVQIEIERIIGDVQDTLNFQKFIGDELNKEFCAFLRMDEYSNDNYISDGLDNTELFQNAFDFINVATKELYKSATLQHSITGTLKNFLRMREFAPIVNSFKNGNWITIQIDDEIYQLRIIEYTIDFASSQNIDVTFSDVISAKDIASDIKSILDQASNMATSYGSIVRQSDMNSNFSKKMSDMILKGLDMTNTKIVSSADNQDITWDEHGLLCREFNDILNDYNPCQLKIINHGLYITNDGWKTAKAGVGQFYYFDPKDKAYKEGYGIIADTLVGNLILSSQVGIYNEEKSIEMDKNGIIVTTNTYNKNVFTIKKEITDDEGNITYERQLYIDDNGNIVLGGGASISWDNVIGTDKDGKSNSMSKLFETLNDTLNEKYNYLLDQDDKKAETWYQSGDPSVDWTTDELKARHKGDLWYNINDQKTYIFTGESWELTKTTPPDDVFDKIDGKAQIFISQPVPPYNVGDLWFDSKTSDIMTCVKERDSGDYVASDWEKRNKYTDDSSLTSFIKGEYAETLETVKGQIDEKADTWYQETDPSTAWKTADDKKKHIGDLWYDTKNQKTYIYGAKGWEETKTNPPDSVFDKIDGKAQIFVAQPKPPYAVGDLWFNSKTSDIMTCVKARTTGNFDSTDWEKRNKYTDDSSLTDFINNTYTTDIGNIQDQIDGKIETFRQETDPSTAWKTADDKKKHIGDLWYDTATNETFMYNGAGWSPVAGTVPDEVWGKIDSKCQIFTAQPKPPYNKGDLWFVGSSGDILTCTTVRKDGESYVETDWTKQNKYTDDTTANTIKNGILKSTYIDSQWVIAPNIKGGQLLISNKSGTISAQITSEGKLIAKEGEFSGKIVSTSGEIGGFNIDNYSLWSGQNVLGGSGVYISPKYGISCNSSFQVTTGGKLTATDADITGNITALNITAKQDYSIYYTDVSGKPSDSQKIIKAFTWGAGSKQIGFGLNMESSDPSDIFGMMLYQNTLQSSKRIFLYADDVTVEGQSIFWKEADFYGSVHLKNYANYSANLMVETEGGTIPYRNMKWNPSDKNGASTGTYFSFNGYGHNHTLLPNSNGTLAIGIGDLSPTSNSPIWCLLPYSITTSTTSYNNQPDITNISRASNGVINLGYYGYDENGRKVDYRFDCVYAKSINIGGKTYTSITGGEKGDKGDPGKAATITIGSVQSGSYAEVKNVGTSNAAKLNFVLPKGEKGNPGDASNGGNVNSHLFMKNMNGYKCYSTGGAAVAGMYCNNSNVMFLCDNSYDTILRGSSCRLKSTSGSAITSDIRQKKDFKSLSLYEDFYMDIDTVAYKYKNGKSGRYHVGVKAQQILEALNNNHLSSMDFGGYIEYKVEKDEYEGEKFVPDYDIECGIIYNEFIALNTHMTQKAHLRIDELESEIKELKQIINSLQGVA